MKNTFFILFIVFFSINIKAGDKIGFGGELAYNLPINEIGLGVRSHIHVNQNWFLSPQLSYYPGFINTHEIYAGLGLNYNFIPDAKWGIYPIVAVLYNRWFNYESFNNNTSQLNNFIPEIGIGSVKNFGCIRPFIEYKINANWWESNLRLGALVYFGSCNNKKVCPAYTLN